MLLYYVMNQMEIIQNKDQIKHEKIMKNDGKHYSNHRYCSTDEIKVKASFNLQSVDYSTQINLKLASNNSLYHSYLSINQ